MKLTKYSGVQTALTVFFCVLLNLSVVGQPHSGEEINHRLGHGINLGSIFETYFEKMMGNSWNPEYLNLIDSLGLRHVRIPVRWEGAGRSSVAPPYTISPDFLARIRKAVDATLKHHLLVVLNMHNHQELYNDPEEQKARFLAQWKQISAYFRGYSDSLVFEILNEPHGNLTPEKWNGMQKQALAVIRKDNPERAVVIGPADYNGPGTLSQWQIPDDDHLILSIHYYNPFTFTHQGAEWVSSESNEWQGTEWLDTDVERREAENDLAPVVALSKKNNLPVYIGEFGTYWKADLASRVRWTTYMARYFEQFGWSWAYWNFKSGFGIYNTATGTFEKELVDALLKNRMPVARTYEHTTMYSSDFTTGENGWFLKVNPLNGARATLGREDGELTVQITALGTEDWHIRLINPYLNLNAGVKYSFSFSARAGSNRPVRVSLAKSSPPWTEYGVVSAAITDTTRRFTGTFTMKENDSMARMLIDLGGSQESFILQDFILEELTLPEERE